VARQLPSNTRQPGQSGFMAGQCAQLAGRPVAAARAASPLLAPRGSRGFRSTTVMGLKTGIVGLPNVGKVTLLFALRLLPTPV
jgi:hypothetical protein